MGQRYTFNYLWIIIIAMAMSMNAAFAQAAKSDTIYLHKSKGANKNSYLKNGLSNGGSLPVLKPTSYDIKPSVPRSDDKLLTNVQVFPNPVTDQINFKFTVSRNSNVNISIMDVLGNRVATLFSERVERGETKSTQYLTKQLTSGFYFLRVVAGTESVIKRITIL
jgi:hypothetical protein